MGKFRSLALVVIVVATTSTMVTATENNQTPSQNCGQANGQMTSGGTVSPLYFPWTVSITDKDGKPFCGGVLISYNSVLTAAHCVSEIAAGDLKLVLGVHDLSKVIASDYFEVTSIEVHPDFSKSGNRGYENDLAILGVNAPAEEPNIGPICIFQGWGSHSNSVRTVLGWGQTETESTSQTLQQLTLHLTSTRKCGQIWNKSIDPAKILCMGKVAQNICNGDDGGPLMVQNDNGFNYELKGIASYWGPTCGDKYPGVYMNVEGYKTWINEHST